MTTHYTASTGEIFTDDDVHRWAADAEAGFPESNVMPTPPRAWEREQPDMVTVSVRVPVGMRDGVQRRLQQSSRKATMSEFIRAAIAHELARETVEH